MPKPSRMKVSLKDLWISIGLVLMVIPAQSQTNVGGVLTTNAHWTKANSPYIVTSNFQINNGVSLHIDPGVVVKLDDSVSFIVYG